MVPGRHARSGGLPHLIMASTKANFWTRLLDEEAEEETRTQPFSPEWIELAMEQILSSSISGQLRCELSGVKTLLGRQLWDDLNNPYFWVDESMRVHVERVALAETKMALTGRDPSLGIRTDAWRSELQELKSLLTEAKSVPDQV